MVLNLSTYMKLIPHSCLVDELRLRLFGAVPTTSTVFEGQYQSPFDSVPEHLLIILEPQRSKIDEEYEDTIHEDGDVSLKRKQKEWKASETELLSD